MNQRGFTLVEALVALLVGAVVLLGIGSFYVSTLAFWRAGNSQSSLQRQGALILDEMARQIHPACTPGFPASCTISMTPLKTCSGDDDSLQVQNPTGIYCFRLYAAGGNQIVEDRPEGTYNMFSGSQVALTAAACAPATTLFTNPSDPLLPPTAAAVRVCFRLSDAVGNSMKFESAITRRSCNPKTEVC